MSVPKKHHYVPEFYLKRWVGDDNRVSDYRRFNGALTHRRRYPSETGFEVELYSVLTQRDPEKRQAIEKRLLGQIDHGAARALQKMEEAGMPPADSENRNAWTRFLLSLIYRSPYQMERIRQKIAEHRDEVLADVAASYPQMKGASDPETFEEYLAQDNGHIEEESLVSLMVRIMNSEMVGTALIKMRWGLIRFPYLKHNLLTCDIPMMLSNGLGHDDSFVMLPIGPQAVFIAAARGEIIDAFVGQGDGVLVRGLNDAIVKQARQVVISREPTQGRFIENRFRRYDPPDGFLGLQTWKHPLAG